MDYWGNKIDMASLVKMEKILIVSSKRDIYTPLKSVFGVLDASRCP